MKGTRRTSDASLNNVGGTMPGVILHSHPGERSPRLGLHLDPNLQPRMSHLEEKLTGSGLLVSQPIARKGKTSIMEKAPGNEGAVTQSERAQAEEQPEEEDNIDKDYDLTKSPFNPMEGYLGPEQEAMPAVRDQPALHDSLPRYVTQTKYLIDLVPTRKEIVEDKWATKAVPEQSSSSSTTSSSETKDEGGDAAQDLADGEYFEQMEIDYKGTEGTREDVSSGSETYHPIPQLEEDQLLSGEAIDASPQMESTLLADTTKPTADVELPATGSSVITLFTSLGYPLLKYLCWPVAILDGH